MPSPLRPEEALALAAPFTFMKFTLTYDGELPSATSRSPRVREKWEIRKVIHPQLAELWENSEELRRLAVRQVPLGQGGFFPVETHHSEAPVPPPGFAVEKRDGYLHLCEPLNVKGRLFLPLVRSSLALGCALDILFLRKEEPGKIITQGGDIDNRIKTLFDALRMPTPDDFNGTEGDLPATLYCLLESDSLINDVAIRTDRLLSRPGASTSEVRLVIEVKVKVMQVRAYNMTLLGD